MKFLIDAQLPRRIAFKLKSLGYDAIHTLDLPNQNYSSDRQVMQRAILDGRIVVTKDDDFVQNYLLKGEPALLLIATGNIRNTELEQLLFLKPILRRTTTHALVAKATIFSGIRMMSALRSYRSCSK